MLQAESGRQQKREPNPPKLMERHTFPSNPSYSLPASSSQPCTGTQTHFTHCTYRTAHTHTHTHTLTPRTRSGAHRTPPSPGFWLVHTCCCWCPSRVSGPASLQAPDSYLCDTAPPGICTLGSPLPLNLGWPQPHGRSDAMWLSRLEHEKTHRLVSWGAHSGDTPWNPTSMLGEVLVAASIQLLVLTACPLYEGGTLDAQPCRTFR